MCGVADVREAVPVGEAADRDEPVAAPQDPAVDVPRRAGQRRRLAGRRARVRHGGTALGAGRRQRHQPAIDPAPDGVAAAPAERRVRRGGGERAPPEHPDRPADSAAGATDPRRRPSLVGGGVSHGGRWSDGRRQVGDRQPGRRLRPQRQVFHTVV